MLQNRLQLCRLPPPFLPEKTEGEQCLWVEYYCLKDYCPLGVYCLPEPGYLECWHGTLFVQGHYFHVEGPLKGAVLRFKLMLQDYPLTQPKVWLQCPHPLVDPLTGFLDLGLNFPIWNANTIFIHHLLLYMVTLLEWSHATEHAIQEYLTGELNEVQSLFINDYPAFMGQLFRFVRDQDVYAEPDSMIVFKPWDLDEHPPLLKRVTSRSDL